MIKLVMVQNEKTQKELQNIEDNFGTIVEIKYINETAYSLGLEDLEFEIGVELKNDLNFEIENCDENSFYINTDEYGVWFDYDKETHEFDLATKRHDYDENSLSNMYKEAYKNKRTVKTARAVVNYVERFI